MILLPLSTTKRTSSRRTAAIVVFLPFISSIHAFYKVPPPTTTTTTTTTSLYGGTKMNDRLLPEKLLIGYSKSEDLVQQAVVDGVNVVIWCFMEMEQKEEIQITTNLDLSKVQTLIKDLDRQGYQDVIHLVSFGGWNGPHLDPNIPSAQQWWDTWKNQVGHIFHGIDWDLEGNDDLSSPRNTFTLECLDRMGEISRLAKQDGYIIGMAPPQSYLDVTNTNFSRRVNLTEPDRPWHAEFSYFGANVYAYLLAKYGEWIDFVSMQFYESYSKASLQIQYYDQSPETYLQSYVERLVVQQQETFPVNFDQDEKLKHDDSLISPYEVHLPRSKLVLGFANAWALAEDLPDGKVFYVTPTQIQLAYQRLQQNNMTPRGFMFWTIDEEGTRGIHFAQGLNQILQIRQTTK